MLAAIDKCPDYKINTTINLLFSRFEFRQQGKEETKTKSITSAKLPFLQFYHPYIYNHR